MEITITTIKIESEELIKLLGREVKQEVKTEKKSKDEFSQYARIFDNGCPGWTKDAEYNLAFLKQQQDYLNEQLKARGYLFLNEVYERLGIPKTKDGQVVGWIYNTENPIGDNFVSFGLDNLNNQIVSDFVNGYERNVMLDFNVDGNILDRI